MVALLCFQKMFCAINNVFAMRTHHPILTLHSHSIQPNCHPPLVMEELTADYFQLACAKLFWSLNLSFFFLLKCYAQKLNFKLRLIHEMYLK